MHLFVSIFTLFFMILMCHVNMFFALLFPLCLTILLSLYIGYEAMLLPEPVLVHVDKWAIKIKQHNIDRSIKKARWQEKMTDEDSERLADQFRKVDQEIEPQICVTTTQDEPEEIAEELKANVVEEPENSPSDIPTGLLEMLDNTSSVEEVLLPEWIDNQGLDIEISSEDRQALLEIEDIEEQAYINSLIASFSESYLRLFWADNKDWECESIELEEQETTA